MLIVVFLHRWMTIVETRTIDGGDSRYLLCWENGFGFLTNTLGLTWAFL